MSNCHDKPDCLPCNPCVTCDPCDPDYTDVGCCEIIPSKCVIYSGLDIDCLNIKKSENLDQILQHLKDVICALGPGGFGDFDFGCFASQNITTEQEFVEFICDIICQILGTDTPGNVHNLSSLYALIQSLTTDVNNIKNQTLVSCFRTLSGLTTPQNISNLLTAIQNVICNLSDRIDDIVANGSETPITTNNIEKDVQLTASGSHNHTLTARVILDPDGTNALTTSGVGLKCVSPQITVVDSESIDLTKSGTLGHTITADLKISATANNAASILSDGLYVNPASVTETPLTANDSTSIDFTTSGTSNHTITASVKLNPSLSNLIQSTGSGLLVTASSVQDPITPIDSPSIDLTVTGGSGHTLRADAIISPTAGNALQLLSNGLFVNSTTTSSDAWGILGNAGMAQDVNFIGTTDNNPLQFRVNNVASGMINSLGKVLLGYRAGINDLYAGGTIAIGYGALQQNTTGSENEAVGYAALNANTIGNNNVAFGSSAMVLSTTSDNSTAIGYRSLFNLTTGDFNTALGSGSGAVLTTGTYNTFLGYNAVTSLATVTKSVAIGANSIVSANNNVVLGGTGADAVSVVVGATAADTTAVMDLTSTIKGFLPPRMTTTQKNAIISPAEGLVVYDITAHKLYCYDGSTWQAAW